MRLFLLSLTVISIFASCQNTPTTTQEATTETPMEAPASPKANTAAPAPADDNYDDLAAMEVKMADQSADDVYKEVMRIHDEVMPVMGDLNRNGRKLKSFMGANENLDENTLNSIRNTITTLAAADDRMMNWMKNIKTPNELPAGLNQQQIKLYYLSELKNVKDVDQLIVYALQESNDLVQKLEIK